MITLVEYQTLASRTCPSLGSIELDMLHMRMGVMSELGELIDPFKKRIAYKKALDMTNVREEIADMCWYLVNEMRIQGMIIDFEFDIADFKQNELLTTEQAAQSITLGLTEAYLAITNSAKIEAYYEYLNALFQLCCHLGIDFYMALDLNIKKLQARYPEKFTEEAALNRDLIVERKILEGEELFFTKETGQAG